MTLFSELPGPSGTTVRLLNEQVYSLTVNGRPLASATLLPEQLEEFAAGYLVTEGITAYSEIESIMPDTAAIGVLTVNPFKVLLPKKTVVSGCGGTASYLDPARLPRVPDGGCVSLCGLTPEFPAEILAAGGFAAAAYTQAGCAASASDLSQHAAFDKVIGSLLRQGCSPAGAAVICSGKITAELVRKSLHAQIPLLASCMPPTALAVATAQAGNLTLVQFPEKIVYCGAGRLSPV